MAVSIRSPHKSKGRLLYLGSCGFSFFVSIRSPHKSKGRPVIFGLRAAGRWFQSAPLTKARGDDSTRPRGIYLLLFQSAPLTKARGDPKPPEAPRSTILFQSAPLTKARGDWIRRLIQQRMISFNPLPSQKQGETPGYRSNPPAGTRFQSAPLTKARGDVGGNYTNCCCIRVSIRSPHKSKGRRTILTCLCG